MCASPVHCGHNAMFGGEDLGRWLLGDSRKRLRRFRGNRQYAVWDFKQLQYRAPRCAIVRKADIAEVGHGPMGLFEATHVRASGPGGFKKDPGVYR